ncbi:type VI secretion system tip protein TssI/VgrG [Sulfitobacter sp. F26204]|uniref:type VI secretion system Vgr family protein n=1 Tax=Sulfitobacter sp. F26204 TaxID=2996014 RepID=UPI00225E2A36|nr:type VI secretion system tip protein TssI/VgrG [Sulfitobacter sp. F26204]MCX7561331.1 type VI secretion system tip protein TssI/VgrG [Sulfitobacter sp. F26204]
MTLSKPREDASTWMSGTYSTDKLQLNKAVVREKLSTLTETTIEFVADNTDVKLNDIVGEIMTLHIRNDGPGPEERLFTGTCISVEALGLRDGKDLFAAQVRPWFWMATLTRETRVFQEKTVKQIIDEVLKEGLGFSDYKFKTSGSFETREYCVQYRESDFDFLSRLMEEEGLYYFFDHTDANMKNEQMIIGDSLSAHSNVEGDSEIKFKARDGKDTKSGGTIGEWSAANNITRGKVSLADYDFEKPSVRQMASTNTSNTKYGDKKHEFYDHPGHYRGKQDLGNTRTRIRMEADEVRHVMHRGAGDARHFGTGSLFKLLEHPEAKNNIEYLICETVHYIRDAEEQKDNGTWLALQPQNIEIPDEVTNDYSFTFGAIPKKVQFRAPFVTPWPEIPGIQIGEVVGPDGEEIHTDEYGRVRVRFRWDRDEKHTDETSSCWIRVVTQWSGKNWGLLSIPRIGQEVVVQFEDGDPDRPIVTGMMYNKDTMPPYVDPDQPTRTGIMTRSSPDGKAKDYNAIVFEDKAGDEYVNIQSQKDYQMVIKDSAEIIIGNDAITVDPQAQSVDPQSLKQTVRKHVTEMVEEGDKSETVDQGKLDLTVEKNMSETVRSGDKSVDVQSGKSTTTVAQNIDVTSGASINATATQSITLEANQSITLKVPGSSIELGPSGITIKTAGMMTVEGTMTQVKGSAVAILKAPVVTIN